MLTKFYLTLAGVILFGYAWVSLFGWEFGNPGRERLAAGAVRSPTGFRSPHFVAIGYRGGK